MRLILLALLIATPATAQTPPTDPVAVMDRVLTAIRMIDRTPDAVMQAFLPEAAAQDRSVAALGILPDELNDPQAVVFRTSWTGADPFGADSIGLVCMRYGAVTLDYARQHGALGLGPILLSAPNEGWTDIPADPVDLSGFPDGAILRQDCAMQVGLPEGMPVQALANWPPPALEAVRAAFETVTVKELDGMIPTPNRRLGVQATGSKGDPTIQVRLLAGMLPYRPFDDVTVPAFGLELRATTYLFAPDS